MPVLPAIMQDADWSDYQIFLAVARAGQLARAARNLRLDATTVGRRLRRLESRLGVTLFEQTRDGQQITGAGEALLDRVEAMATAAASIGEGDAGQAGGLGGILRISVSEGFGGWFLARHVARFAAQHSRLTLDIVASSGFLSPSKREADIAVTLSRPKAGPLVARKLSDYALGLYASRDYLQQAGMPAVLADLTHGQQLVGYVPDLLYAPELNYLDEIYEGLAPTIRSSSINAQQSLLASGAGVGVLPRFMGDASTRLVRVLPERTILRSFWLVTHRETRQSPRVRTFCDWLIELVGQERAVLLPPT